MDHLILRQNPVPELAVKQPGGCGQAEKTRAKISVSQRVFSLFPEVAADISSHHKVSQVQQPLEIPGQSRVCRQRHPGQGAEDSGSQLRPFPHPLLQGS